MIKALETATQGLLQAERRATDIAKDILKTTSEAASFSTEEGNNALPPSDAAANNIPNNSAGNSGPSTAASTINQSGFGDLIQQFADLRAEQHAFEANAKVFKAADESLGTLIDDLG